jgi:hypothetical protein
MTGIIAAGAVALVLLFLTGPMALLPIPALGAIVLAGALHFIKAGEIVRIWRIQPSEGAIAAVAAACVVLYGTLVGVGVAALLAAFNVFRRASKPHIAELGRMSGEDFADVERSPEARRTPGVLIVRFAGPLFFATATALGDRIRQLAASREPLSSVVLDAYAVVDLDLTATDAIRTIERELAKAGTTLVIARPTGALRDRMRAYGLGHLVPAHGQRLTLTEVVEAAGIRAAASTGTTEPGLEAGSGDAEEARRAADDTAAETHPGPWPPLGDRPVGDRPGTTRSRPKIGVVAIAAIAVLGVTIAAFTLGRQPSTPPPTGDVVTPNLVGIPVDRARSTVEGAGLVLGPATYHQTDAYPEGTVISQSPGPGTPVPYGSVVVPTVSTARELVAVPDVIGAPQSDAIFAITTAGLRVSSTIRAADPGVPAGAVISSDPVAGRLVAVGTGVVLTVSSGPDDTTGASPTPGATASPVPSAPASTAPSPATSPGVTASPGPSGTSPGPSAVPSAASSPSPAPSRP